MAMSMQSAYRMMNSVDAQHFYNFVLDARHVIG